LTTLAFELVTVSVRFAAGVSRSPIVKLIGLARSPYRR